MLWPLAAVPLGLVTTQGLYAFSEVIKLSPNGSQGQQYVNHTGGQVSGGSGSLKHCDQTAAAAFLPGTRKKRVCLAGREAL